jgi:hypothetical protein
MAQAIAWDGTQLIHMHDFVTVIHLMHPGVLLRLFGPYDPLAAATIG